MSVKITWPFKNLDLDAINIYRALNKIDFSTNPTPIVTLPGTATEYVDTEAAMGEIYTYYVEAVKGADNFISEPIRHGNFPNNGPGPQNIIKGDWDNGYFGTIPYEEFISNSDFFAWAGITPGSIAQTAVPVWHKFIYNKKIIFMPARFIHSVNFYTLYNAGLYFGVDGPGRQPGMLYPPDDVNQLRIIEIGGYQFKVRTPKSNRADYKNSEWNNTYVRLNTQSQAAGLKGLYGDATPVSGNVHGDGYSTDATNATSIITLPPTYGAVSTVGHSSSTPWVPVLELIY